MDTPLMGTPRGNYTFFYAAGGGVMISLVLLLVITSYSAVMVGDANILMKDMHEVITGIKELLPEAKFGADMLGSLCDNANFTNWYPNIRPICAEHH